jgi:hypothetical protein
MGNEKAVLFIGSDRPIVGREQDAMNLWSELGAWLDAQQKAGWFARWDSYWLTPHGGTLGSAIQCFGDRAKLDEWRRTDAFEALVFRMSACVGNLMVVPGVAYAAAKETMDRRTRALAK